MHERLHGKRRGEGKPQIRDNEAEDHDGARAEEQTQIVARKKMSGPTTAIKDKTATTKGMMKLYGLKLMDAEMTEKGDSAKL